MSRSARPYDIIVFGATGFTGKLVAEYLAHQPKLKWAIAGRDPKKLAAVSADIATIIATSGGTQPAVLSANANDAKSMDEVTKQGRVIISTVGPFMLYGEPLIKYCAQNGTDYVDTTGEAQWHRAMIDKYNKDAVASGAILVPQCGFDSMPSDLGTYFIVDYIRTQLKQGTKSVLSNFSLDGGGSGGTAQTMVAIIESPNGVRNERNAYLLNPEPSASILKKTANPFEREVLFPSWNADLKRWSIPFFMASTNTKVVRRSAALHAAGGADSPALAASAVTSTAAFTPYGNGFGYNEVWSFKYFFMAFFTWLGLALGLFAVINPITRPIAKLVLPKSGEGPSAERRARSWFRNVLVAETENGTKVKALVSGGCPGYGETAKMVAEAALTLAEDRDQLRVKGGFSTPAVALGQTLIRRLHRKGIKFAILDDYKNE